VRLFTLKPKQARGKYIYIYSLMKESYNPETYWDEVAATISSRTDLKLIAGDDEPYYRYKRKRFLELLNTIDFTNKTVLEIGSGPGGNLDFIYRKGCRKITGADVSSQMIALAKQLLSKKDIDIVKINGRDLPFDNNQFDLVFTSTVLQHNTDETQLKKLIKEIARVSKKEVLLFERIENTIRGHGTNLGRPVSYYRELLEQEGFMLKETKPLPIQASYYCCGIIRKVFNPKGRKEGEPLTKISIALEKITLPLTSILDKLIPSKRDVILLRFEK
jgi:ubiquinone/menaquinone biosynthesis C-methylase UbiE